MHVQLLVTLDVSTDTTPEEARDLFKDIAEKAVLNCKDFDMFLSAMDVEKVELYNKEL